MYRKQSENINDIMSFQVKFTDEARQNYRDIITYLEEKFGTSSKLKFQRRFLEFSNLIAENAHLFPELLPYKSIRRSLLSKEASAYYRIVGQEVQIIAIIDNRKQSSDFE